MQTGYKKQKRHLNNDLLPQYAGGATGFNPMGAAQSKRDSQELTDNAGHAHTQHQFLSPMHNAINANQHAQAAPVNGSAAPGASIPTGYPSRPANANAVYPAPGGPPTV